MYELSNYHSKPESLQHILVVSDLASQCYGMWSKTLDFKAHRRFALATRTCKVLDAASGHGLPSC